MSKFEALSPVMVKICSCNSKQTNKQNNMLDELLLFFLKKHIHILEEQI
jgi:hypothetical protein